LKLDGITVNRMRDFEALDQVKPDPHFGKAAADDRTWKSSGCSFIDGALYCSISRHNYGDPFGERRRQDALNGSIIKSTDYGKTWTRSAQENYDAPMFPGPNFATPYFVEYGKTPAPPDGGDKYVYAISNNGFWDNGDYLILGRVERK